MKAAEAVGYQVDPLVSRLMSRIRTPSEKRARATIALLGPWSPDHDEAKDGYFARLLAGARARAMEKGSAATASSRVAAGFRESS